MNRKIITLIIVFIACLGIIIWIWQTGHLLTGPKKILSDSFSKFRSVNSFHYTEKRTDEDTKSNGELGYLGIKNFEGFFSFPDKTSMATNGLRLRDMGGTAYSGNEAVSGSSELIILGDKVYYKADEAGPDFLSYLLDGRYWQYSVDQMGEDILYGEDFLTVIEWLKEGLNLNNPKIINEVGGMEIESIDGRDYYKIAINSFDQEKYIKGWDNSDTQIRNLFYGYDIEEFYEWYVVIENKTSGTIWIDKETLLPYRIEAKLLLGHRRDDIDYFQTVEREIVFDQYNDDSNLSEIPTDIDIVDQEEYNRVFQKRLEELKED